MIDSSCRKSTRNKFYKSSTKPWWSHEAARVQPRCWAVTYGEYLPTRPCWWVHASSGLGRVLFSGTELNLSRMDVPGSSVRRSDRNFPQTAWIVAKHSGIACVTNIQQLVLLAIDSTGMWLQLSQSQGLANSRRTADQGHTWAQWSPLSK
jgi:hypothetical protein